MRYFIVTYYRKPDGKIDEQVAISKNLKESDIQTANIIMDFKEKKIVKSIVQGQKIDTDWDKLLDHYRQVYPDYIDQLEQLNTEE